MSLGELFTALGYVVGGVVFFLAARERKLATEGVGWIVGIGILSSAIGARLCQLLAEGWPTRIPFLVALHPETGGRALLGGVIFGWLGVELTKRKLGMRRSMGDMFALALPAGEAIGRIGCFFNGCCFGTACTVPWAVYQHDAWRHPAQLYSAFVSAGLFGALLVAKKHLRREGDLFRLYLLGFGATRFLLEFVRWRESLVWGLSPMQWFCLDLITLATFQLWRGRKVHAAA